MFLNLRASRTLKGLVRGVLGRSTEERVPRTYSDLDRAEIPRPAGPPTDVQMAQAAAWLAALEAGHLHPPRDVHDPGAWDVYWRNHLSVGPMEQGFSDMMSSDPELPGLLARRRARTILCAGNGFSAEALSLTLFGFNVTALDISTVPSEMIASALRQPEHPVHGIPGFSIDDTNVVSFNHAGTIEPERCPPIHRSANHSPRGGGTLSFVTGDLVNPEVCPGPFDVVIERRTVQLFPPEERIPAVQRLVARLGDRGVFVSQQHAGGWRPGEPRTHYAEDWLRSEGFVMRSGSDRELADSAPRLASVMFSTG
jgi:hypothetical protein